jgi:hypothetical protein
MPLEASATARCDTPALAAFCFSSARKRSKLRLPWHAAPPRNAGAAAALGAFTSRGATGLYGAGNGCCADEPCESASNATAVAIVTRIPGNGIGISSPFSARLSSPFEYPKTCAKGNPRSARQPVLVSSLLPCAWRLYTCQRACSNSADKSHRSGANAAHRSCIRTDGEIAEIVQERTSKIMLNGVSVARRNCLKPASVATWRSLRSPACAPSPQPTSCDSDAGVQMKVDA